LNYSILNIEFIFIVIERHLLLNLLNFINIEVLILIIFDHVFIEFYNILKFLLKFLGGDFVVLINET